MARVFLDTNYFIGLANRAPEVETEILDEQKGFISTLSCHILFYVNKINVPDIKMNSFISDFNLIDLTQDILDKALIGPTKNLEDNIQLHSAAEAECDIFLTSDARLLKMKFFGKTEIKSSLMKTVTVSAPGKLMLLGEHAVVYGQPCIVTAVGQRMKATVELTDEPIFSLNAPDVQVLDYKKPMSELGQGDIPKGAKFVEIAVLSFTRPLLEYSRSGLKKLGIKITTASEFSSQFGFGSSSASTVCVIKALSEITGANLDNTTIFDLAYKTVLDIQGKGSGFDVAAAVYGGILYFKKGGEIIEPLSIDSLPLIVGYSGIKADTVTLMNQVLKKDQKVVEGIYTKIGKLVEQAKVAILSKDWSLLGELMNSNQKLLESLGVSIQKLDDMIFAANSSGAYGAKLSGAGGGDCMIALAPEDQAEVVKAGITSAGGQIIEIKANTEGVRIDG